MLNVYIYGDLEIEPFRKFSLKYSSVYWFTKYQLTQNKFVPIDEENQILFETEKINPIWLNLTDQKSFEISCHDGDIWILQKLGVNEYLDNLLLEGNIKTKIGGN